MSKSIIDVLSLESPINMEYSVCFETDKDKIKFIQRCERIIRSSKEYKDYIRFLRDNMDMDRCAFFQGIKHTKDNKVQIEVHHEPFTLYDIVWAVVNKQLEEGKELNDLDIADEVMELHYNDMVGLIPLSVTVHELVHSGTGKVFIPMNMCYGNYKKFYEEYQDYMEDETISRLEAKIEKTKEMKEEDFDVLKVQFQYLDVNGVENPKKMQTKKGMVA